MRLHSARLVTLGLAIAAAIAEGAGANLQLLSAAAGRTDEFQVGVQFVRA